MKRMTWAGGSIITGSATAAAILDYAVQSTQNGTSAAVDIPVLEANGTVATHTVLIGPNIQVDVTDVDGSSSDLDEDTAFPIPDFPVIPSQTLRPVTEAADVRHFEIIPEDELLG